MKKKVTIIPLLLLLAAPIKAQKGDNDFVTEKDYQQLPSMPVYVQMGHAIDKGGDTIRMIVLPPLYVYPPLKFKNPKQMQKYNRLVYNVKKVLPIAKEANQVMQETYEYLQTLPDKRSKDAHIQQVEKGVKKQYTPVMKQLTFSQGKLLIKLIHRECHQNSYEIVRAFIGPLKATFYQTFAKFFGASLKKEYDPENDDRMIERVACMVESGQL
jgi:hypothetical protein